MTTLDSHDLLMKNARGFFLKRITMLVYNARKWRYVLDAVVQTERCGSADRRLDQLSGVNAVAGVESQQTSALAAFQVASTSTH